MYAHDFDAISVDIVNKVKCDFTELPDIFYQATSCYGENAKKLGYIPTSYLVVDVLHGKDLCRVLYFIPMYIVRIRQPHLCVICLSVSQ